MRRILQLPHPFRDLAWVRLFRTASVRGLTITIDIFESIQRRYMNV